jgi:hypothetical protein
MSSYAVRMRVGLKASATRIEISDGCEAGTQVSVTKVTNMTSREVWLRGPVPDIPPLLQPVAHGLLQCGEEVRANILPLSPAIIWARPGGAASIGFHVRHAAGSLDRLFTYARGQQLSRDQLAALAAEDDPSVQPNEGAALVIAFEQAIERALAQLRTTSDAALQHPRDVGRARLPSTVGGLLFHAAEHTQRHVGQLVTTRKIVMASPQ